MSNNTRAKPGAEWAKRARAADDFYSAKKRLWRWLKRRFDLSITIAAVGGYVVRCLHEPRPFEWWHLIHIPCVVVCILALSYIRAKIDVCYKLRAT